MAYLEVNTPSTRLEIKSSYLKNDDNMEEPADGALRKGGVVNVFTKEYLGLVANYACMGIVNGAFPRTIYPFLNNYLRLDGYQAVAAETLLDLPFTLNLFIGIISDSFPIYGLRRKPYMIIGWVGCFLSLACMSFMAVADPYYIFPEDAQVMNKSTIDPSRLNLEAKAAGPQYILLMMLASLFYVIALVAADGIVIELAMREPEAVRGKTQISMYMTRDVFSVLGIALVGLTMNDASYGGSFGWGLKFNHVMGILSAVILCSLPLFIFFVKDEVKERESFRGRCRVMKKLVEKRAVWQIMALKFFSTAFYSFGAAPTNIVQREWAHVEPFNDSVFSMVGKLVVAGSLFATKKWGLNWDWRKTIAYSTLFAVFIDSIVSYFTIFAVFRSQWFWLGVPILEDVPLAIRYIVSTLVVVEIAEEGYEGATYGLMTTVTKLSSKVMPSIYKTVDSHFDAYEEHVRLDTPHVRRQVAYTYTLMYIMKLLSIFWLILLPRQKKECQELKKRGGSSKIAGTISIVIALTAFIYAITSNILSIFPTTSCLRIAGGRGC